MWRADSWVPRRDSLRNLNKLQAGVEKSLDAARMSARGTFIVFIAGVFSLAWADQPHGEMVHGTRAQSSFAFRAAGVYWRDAWTTHVRARASTDGRNWTRWLE